MADDKALSGSFAFLQYSLDLKVSIEKCSVLKLPRKDETYKNHGIPVVSAFCGVPFAKKSEIHVIHFFHKLLY